MKLGILGDLHLRATPPINRTDDYYNTQFQKLAQAFDHFSEECVAVLQPGDFFNNYGRDPYGLVYDTISFLKQYKLPVYAVLGQHDIKFHNIDATDIPFQLLVNAGYIIPLNQKDSIEIEKDVHLWGLNWNQSTAYSYCSRDPEEIINIILMHKMIIKGKKLWPGQTDYIQAKQLNLGKLSSYDLYVCGDNHQAFTHEDRIINCGSLCRMSMDQTDHQPMYAIYDTEEREFETFEYEIAPADEVLKVLEFNKTKIDQKLKDEYVQSLHSEFDGEVNFRHNINEILNQKRRVKNRTKDIIEEALECQKT